MARRGPRRPRSGSCASRVGRGVEPAGRRGAAHPGAEAGQFRWRDVGWRDVTSSCLEIARASRLNPANPRRLRGLSSFIGLSLWQSALLMDKLHPLGLSSLAIEKPPMIRFACHSCKAVLYVGDEDAGTPSNAR